MRKKLFLTLLCAVLAAGAVGTLTGCKSGGGTGGVGEKGNADSEIRGELSLLTSESIYNDCEADHGYYYINGEGTNLMYIDYESKQEVYLCNSPGCKHDTQECTSYIGGDNVGMENSLFYYKDYLYLFTHSYDNDGVTSTTISYDDSAIADGSPIDNSLACEPAVLYRMKPDGTQREKVYTFEEGLTIEKTILNDDNGLYFIAKELKSEKKDANTTSISSEGRRLLRVDIDSWKEEKICDMEQDSGIVGCYENQLLLSYMQYDHELTEEEKDDDDKMREALLASESVYMLFDVESGEKKEIYRHKNDKLGNLFSKGQYLYIANEGEDIIWKMDIETGKKEEFCKTPYNNLNDIYDDVLICWPWGSDDNGVLTDPINYFIHLDDGSLEKSGLKNHYGNYGLEIRAETPTQFLVVYDYDAEIDPIYPDQDNIHANKFALIDKEDLYSGKEKYEKIKMTSNGM